MSIKITKYFNDSVILIENISYSDNRGHFSEIYIKKIFKNLSINVEFVQDNISLSKNENTLEDCIFKILLLLKQNLFK